MPSLIDTSRISPLTSSPTPVEHNTRSSSISSYHRGSRRLQDLKTVVEKAIQNHKTFTIFGPFACIKYALKLRGWVEKFEYKQRHDDIKYERSASDTLIQEKSTSHDASDSSNGNQSEYALDEIQMSRLLRDYSVDFIWTMKNEPIKWKRLNSRTLVSRFSRADFTTKAGLCSSLQQNHWYYEDDISMILFPRCYNTAMEDELAEFIKDFRLTACVGLIRLICENSISEENIIFQKDGKIPTSSIEFALKRCKEYVAKQEHFDIDQQIGIKIWDHQWDQFLTCYYKLVHDEEFFACENDEDAAAIQKQCQESFTHLADHWPQLHLDGTNNLWIIKPAAKSRGRGIQIMRKLEDVLAKVNSQQGKECRYVAQKYIERPLLIYETKFDIRQWFLITSAYPLTVWIYKESYLRFCSQVFSLLDTHESVHLSNNAVQCKYTNGVRDRNLPDENMWDCYTFQTYLRSKGRSDLWDTVIYPGMRKNIIGTLLASQDTLDSRRGCFELFGADFMLSETYEPWLIEINSGPSMSPSTSVTARMCAQVLDDVIKVVIDRKHDKNADTGMFELAYKQIIPPVQPYMGQNLVVRGSKIEDGRTRTVKKRSSPCRPRKRKLSNPWLGTTSSMGSNYARNSMERGRSGGRTRVPRADSKSATIKENSNNEASNRYQKKEKVSVRLGKNQNEISSKGGLEDLTNALEGNILSRERERTAKKLQAEMEIHSLLLPAVSEGMKCKPNKLLLSEIALRNDTEILPPIEVPSR